MNYFTYDDITLKYRKIPEDFTSDAVGSYWAPAASSRIDAVLATRYTVPFSPVPFVIRDLAVDMAYWGMTYRELNQELLKKDIDARLAAISSGTLTLTDPVTGASLQTSTRVTLTTSGYRSSFGMDRPEDFSIDRNWQSDFRNSRGECG